MADPSPPSVPRYSPFGASQRTKFSGKLQHRLLLEHGIGFVAGAERNGSDA